MRASILFSLFACACAGCSGSVDAESAAADAGQDDLEAPDAAADAIADPPPDASTDSLTDAVTDAPQTGAASVSGSVGGRELEPTSVIAGISPIYIFVFTSVKTDHTAIAISDFVDQCGNTNVQGMSLYFDLFHDATQPDSSVKEPGTYEAWLPALDGEDPIPTDDRAVVTSIYNSDQGGEAFVAQTGQVDVTEVSDVHIAGTFDLTFEAGSVSGTFDAPFCEPWTRGSSVPSPQGDAGGS